MFSHQHWLFLPVICIACLLITLPHAQAQIKNSAGGRERMLGEWKNPDKDTRGITRLKIELDGETLKVSGWGKCDPTDCAWGSVTLAALGENVDDKQASYGFATWDHKHATTHLTLKFENQSVLAQTYTIFKDGSNRANYRTQYRLKHSK